MGGANRSRGSRAAEAGRLPLKAQQSAPPCFARDRKRRLCGDLEGFSVGRCGLGRRVFGRRGGVRGGRCKIDVLFWRILDALFHNYAVPCGAGLGCGVERRRRSQHDDVGAWFEKLHEVLVFGRASGDISAGIARKLFHDVRGDLARGGPSFALKQHLALGLCRHDVDAEATALAVLVAIPNLPAARGVVRAYESFERFTGLAAAVKVGVVSERHSSTEPVSSAGVNFFGRRAAHFRASASATRRW